jgi:hypothetical protein
VPQSRRGALRGVLLCEPHAWLLGLEDRAEALLGSVFRMDEWMEENRSTAADEEFVGRVRHERDEAVSVLRLTRAQLRSACKAVGKEGSGRAGARGNFRGSELTNFGEPPLLKPSEK